MLLTSGCQTTPPLPVKVTEALNGPPVNWLVSAPEAVAWTLSHHMVQSTFHVVYMDTNMSKNHHRTLKPKQQLQEAEGRLPDAAIAKAQEAKPAER